LEKIFFYLAGIERTRDISDGIGDHRLDVLAAIDSGAIPMSFLTRRECAWKVSHVQLDCDPCTALWKTATERSFACVLACTPDDFMCCLVSPCSTCDLE